MYTCTFGLSLVNFAPARAEMSHDSLQDSSGGSYARPHSTEFHFMTSQNSIRFVAHTFKNGGVIVTQTHAFIKHYTTCFGPDKPSSGDS
jgi:hypothetical protein